MYISKRERKRNQTKSGRERRKEVQEGTNVHKRERG